jgi:hypothetical protein
MAQRKPTMQRQGAASGAPTPKQKYNQLKTNIAATPQINKSPFSRQREKGRG